MTLFKPLDPAVPEAYPCYETFCFSELMTCSQFSLLKQVCGEFLSLAARVLSNMVVLKVWSPDQQIQLTCELAFYMYVSLLSSTFTCLRDSLGESLLKPS